MANWRIGAMGHHFKRIAKSKRISESKSYLEEAEEKTRGTLKEELG